MKRIIYFFLFTLAIPFYNFAQTNGSPPQIIPKSPEADNLGRYGEVAVGEFTGAPDISIPIHVIQSGSLKFPINLTYNATGVRVNQEASWVGLGWDLSALGGISYTPVGGNDQIHAGNNGIDWLYWQEVIDWINPLKIYPTVGYEVYLTALGDSPTPMQCVYAAMDGNGQHDLYSVSAPGISFKFYINPQTGIPTIYGDKNSFKITTLPGGPNAGFVIIDGRGVKYTFSVVESSQNLPGVINEWYLSEVRNPDDHWLKFKYSTFGTTILIPPLSEKVVSSMTAVGTMGPSELIGSNQRYLSQDVNTINGQYLTEIESMTEVIRFKLSNRLDLAGVGVRKLDSMIVENKFSSHKRIVDFQYDYFIGSDVGGDYLTDGTYGGRGSISDANLRKRLKLTGILERNISGSDTRHYSLEYNETTPLPLKTSFAIDHWGFYNGEENLSGLLNYGNSGRTVIPKLFSVSLFNWIPPLFPIADDPYEGAVRGASPTHMGAAILKSIIYPTGGKSQFTFEPHVFKNDTILSAAEEVFYNQDTSIYVYDLNYADGSGLPYTHADFQLHSQRKVHFLVHFNNKQGAFNYSQISPSQVTLLSNVPDVHVVKTWVPTFFSNGQTYNQVFDENLTLPPGVYNIQVNLPDGLGFQGYSPLVETTLGYKVQAAPQIPANHESIGGGLRIKRIDNYDQNNALVYSKQFSYLNIDGSTSGSLKTPLNYLTPAMMWHCENTRDTKYYSCVYRNSNNSFSLSTSPIPAVVGYDRVVIKELDKSGLASNGMTIKNFTNSMPLGTFQNDLVINDALLVGDLISTTQLNQFGDTLLVERNEYGINAVEKDWINVTSKQLALYDDDCLKDGRFLIGIYPFVRYRKNKLKSTEVKYSGVQRLVTETDYDYNPTNYAVSESRTMTSAMELKTYRYKYPIDFVLGNNVYSTMANDLNIIDPVVEESSFLNSTPLVRTKTNYSLIANSIKPTSMEEQVGSFVSQTKLTFDRYSNGRISQFTAIDGISKSYIWGYNQCFVIAEVENAKLDNTFYTGFEDVDGANITKLSGKTGNRSLNGPFTKVLPNLTNGIYVLSYWVNASGNWSLQTSNITVTTNSYTINIGSQQVDDIRFYPVVGRMTTYTYDPLLGVTSQTDENGVTTYYEYDELKRLKAVRDTDGKLIKVYKYHYANQN